MAYQRKIPFNMGKIVFEFENNLGIPEMKNHFIECQNLIPFNFCKSKKTGSETVHFYLDDYQFERTWNNPECYVNILRNFNGCFTPDFSLYTDMPLALQLYNIYRSRWIGRYYQTMGINCIPTVSWSTRESYKFCFVGIENCKQVSISSMSIINQKQEAAFLDGYSEMIKQVDPCQVILYGKKIKGFNDDRVIYFEPFYRRINNGRTRSK